MSAPGSPKGKPDFSTVDLDEGKISQRTHSGESVTLNKGGHPAPGDAKAARAETKKASTSTATKCLTATSGCLMDIYKPDYSIKPGAIEDILLNGIPADNNTTLVQRPATVSLINNESFNKVRMGDRVESIDTEKCTVEVRSAITQKNYTLILNKQILKSLKVGDVFVGYDGTHFFIKRKADVYSTSLTREELTAFESGEEVTRPLDINIGEAVVEGLAIGDIVQSVDSAKKTAVMASSIVITGDFVTRLIPGDVVSDYTPGERLLGLIPYSGSLQVKRTLTDRNSRGGLHSLDSHASTLVVVSDSTRFVKYKQAEKLKLNKGDTILAIQDGIITIQKKPAPLTLESKESTETKIITLKDTKLASKLFTGDVIFEVEKDSIIVQGGTIELPADTNFSTYLKANSKVFFDGQELSVTEQKEQEQKEQEYKPIPPHSTLRSDDIVIGKDDDMIYLQYYPEVPEAMTSLARALSPFSTASRAQPAAYAFSNAELKRLLVAYLDLFYTGKEKNPEDESSLLTGDDFVWFKPGNKETILQQEIASEILLTAIRLIMLLIQRDQLENKLRPLINKFSDYNGGCELFIRSQLPKEGDEDLKTYKSCYVLVREKLYYFNNSGICEEVSINNISKLKADLKELLGDDNSRSHAFKNWGLMTNDNSIYLNAEQVTKLITENGGHVQFNLSYPLLTENPSAFSAELNKCIYPSAELSEKQATVIQWYTCLGVPITFVYQILAQAKTIPAMAGYVGFGIAGGSAIGCVAMGLFKYRRHFASGPHTASGKPNIHETVKLWEETTLKILQLATSAKLPECLDFLRFPLKLNEVLTAPSSIPLQPVDATESKGETKKESKGDSKAESPSFKTLASIPEDSASTSYTSPLLKACQQRNEKQAITEIHRLLHLVNNEKKAHLPVYCILQQMIEALNYVQSELKSPDKNIIILTKIRDMLLPACLVLHGKYQYILDTARTATPTLPLYSTTGFVRTLTKRVEAQITAAKIKAEEERPRLQRSPSVAEAGLGSSGTGATSARAATRSGGGGSAAGLSLGGESDSSERYHLLEGNGDRSDTHAAAVDQASESEHVPAQYRA